VVTRAGVKIQRHQIPSNKMKRGDTISARVFYVLIERHGDDVVCGALTMILQAADGNPGLIQQHVVPAYCDVLARHAGFVLRPGEGIAAVAAAETFSSSLNAAGVGGELPILIGINFDVENLVQPYLSLSGLQPGSDIVVLAAGTGNILQQIDQYSGTDWAWAYDPDLVSSVDVCIYKPGYVPLPYRNLTLPSDGVSVPVNQVHDRNYQ
jgi:hypothetical protein